VALHLVALTVQRVSSAALALSRGSLALTLARSLATEEHCRLFDGQEEIGELLIGKAVNEMESTLAFALALSTSTDESSGSAGRFPHVRAPIALGPLILPIERLVNLVTTPVMPTPEC
jgi:hypothetical protein